MINNRKIGLALSGGGFRAAAFHLGTLKKLHSLNLLDKVDFISTISGGSIIGAYYCLHNTDFKSFENEFTKLLMKSLIKRIILSLSVSIRVISIVSLWVLFFFLFSFWVALNFLLITVVLIGVYFFKIFPTTKLKIKAYNKLFYKNQKLDSLPFEPKIVINSTNLDTGTLFSFTKIKSFDSSYNIIFNKKIEFDTRNVSIAEAVACSTSVPYFFSPTEMKLKFDDLIIKPKLVDGGVYDNQGIYRISADHSEYKSDIVIVSDASYPFEKKYLRTNPLPVFNRIMNVMMKRIKSMQFLQKIYENNENELYEISYFSLDWEYEACLWGFANAVQLGKIRPHILEAHKINEELKKDKVKLIDYIKRLIEFDVIIEEGLNNDEIKLIKKIGTSIKALSEREIDLLSRHAAVLTEIQLRFYCPSLFNNII